MQSNGLDGEKRHYSRRLALCPLLVSIPLPALSKYLHLVISFHISYPTQSLIRVAEEGKVSRRGERTVGVQAHQLTSSLQARQSFFS